MDMLKWSGVISAGVLFAAQGLACGVCADDKVAATYDHAVVQQAAESREPAALSFALDPMVQSAPGAVAQIERALDPNVNIALLKSVAPGP